MSDKQTATIINLTPQNAEESGYHYIDDIFYDPDVINEEITDLINKYNYKLGKPSKKNNFESYVGIYAPIKLK